VKDEVCVLSASGQVGSGFSEESFMKALESNPDVIGCDSGSTDSGPYCLGAGVSNKSKKAIKRDLRIMIREGVKRGIPVLIGSAGTSGGKPHLEWTLAIVREIAKEEGLHFKLASIEAELSKDQLRKYMRAGKVHPLAPAPEFGEKELESTERIVGVMGADPYIEALKKGANVVIAGRSSDTSIFAAVPIMEGLDCGATWHAAKILECGAACVESRAYPDCVLAWIRKDSCSIEPPNPIMRCTPVSCVSHMLYENSNPFVLVEPSGTLHAEESEYIAESDRRVRITGSRFEHAKQYTIKLEGVRKIGVRYMTLGAIRDPLIMRQLDNFLDGVKQSIYKKVEASTGLKKDDYCLNIRVYGREPGKVPYEVCIVIEAIAPADEDAKAVIGVAWHTALHHPIPEWSGLQSQLAFPFSPPSFRVGEAYQFCLNHIVDVDDPLELFPITYEDL